MKLTFCKLPKKMSTLHMYKTLRRGSGAESTSSRKANINGRKYSELNAETEEQRQDTEMTLKIISELNNMGNEELYNELKRAYEEVLQQEKRKQVASEQGEQ